MSKKKIFAVFTLVVFILLQSLFVSADSSVFISGSEEYTEAGSVVTVDVSISNNVGISSYLLEIDYDHDTFVLQDVNFNGTFAPDGYTLVNEDYILWGNENTENDEGVLRPYDTTYNGVMFSLTFAVAQDAAPGAYPVDIKLVGDDAWNMSNAAAQPVAVEFSQGMIYIGVSDVYLFQEPTKKDYFVGNEFTSMGGIIRVEYYDGTYIDVPVTEDMCSGYDMNTPGTQTVTISYLDYEFYYDINVVEPVVVNAYLYKEPTKTDYFTGEDFTAEGGIIRIEYSDGSYEDVIVTDDMCSGYDMDTPGKQTVIISYEDYEFPYEITVKDPVIVDAELIEEPDKKVYEKGEGFTSEGGIIRVEYSDGSHIDVPVTEDMCEGYDPETPGKQTITITYEGFEFIYEIEVKEPVIVDAELIEEPDKKEYFTGEAFKPDGGVIRVEYSDGSFVEVPVTEDMCEGYDPETPGKQTITITYEGFEFTYEIEVKVPEVVGAELIKDPSKKDYELGEEFTAEGGIIRVEFSDGTFIEIPVTDDMCSGFDSSKPGKQTITITYGVFEFTFEIIVQDKVVPPTGDSDRVFYVSLALVIACSFVFQAKILKKKCYEK